MLWYLDVFSSSNPGPNSRPGQDGTTGNIVTNLSDSVLNARRNSPGYIPEQIQIIDNQTRPNIYDPLE